MPAARSSTSRCPSRLPSPGSATPSRWLARLRAPSVTTGGPRRSPGGSSTRPSRALAKGVSTIPATPEAWAARLDELAAHARTLADVAAALTAERGEGQDGELVAWARGGARGGRQPPAGPRAPPAASDRQAPSRTVAELSDPPDRQPGERVPGRGGARPPTPGDCRPGAAALPGDGLQLPVRPDPQALLDRVPGPGRHARPELLRPPRLRGPARQLPRDRQGRRPARPLVPARPRPDARRVAARR